MAVTHFLASMATSNSKWNCSNRDGWPESVAGVYVVFDMTHQSMFSGFCPDDGNCLYVGQSKNIKTRLREHAAMAEKTGPDHFFWATFQEVIWIEIEDDEERLRIEKKAINELRPEFNGCHRRGGRPVKRYEIHIGGEE